MEQVKRAASSLVGRTSSRGADTFSHQLTATTPDVSIAQFSPGPRLERNHTPVDRLHHVPIFGTPFSYLND
jgi:hypothetical protein